MVIGLLFNMKGKIMKKYINHKNGNIRKNKISNLEIVKEETDIESTNDILIELSESQRFKRGLNNYRSKDNCIVEDFGKEYTE